MHFPPHYSRNLGFVQPGIVGRVAHQINMPPSTVLAKGARRPAPKPTVTYRGTSGFAKRPVYPSTPKLTTSMMPTRSTPLHVANDPISENYMPDQIIPEQFRYTKEQLRDMLARGHSETVERSGESDSGLPPSPDLEETANQRDATKQYGIDVRAGVTPGAAPDEPNLLPLALAAAAFFLLGG